jgi:hypothetical protein
MVILGVVLLLIGWFLKVQVLLILGVIGIVVGVILLLLDLSGDRIGGRRWY